MQGGGIGFSSARYGVTADGVVAAEVVVYNATLKTYVPVLATTTNQVREHTTKSKSNEHSYAGHHEGARGENSKQNTETLRLVAAVLDDVASSMPTC